VLASKDV
jgi:hypothetical protein